MTAHPLDTMRRCETSRIGFYRKDWTALLCVWLCFWNVLPVDLDVGALSTWRRGRVTVSRRSSFGATVVL